MYDYGYRVIEQKDGFYKLHCPKCKTTHWYPALFILTEMVDLKCPCVKTMEHKIEHLRKTIKDKSIFHGDSATPEFKHIVKCFIGMHSRCYRQTDKSYAHYHKKGITVCDEWSYTQQGYDNFKQWALTHGHDDSLTLDRIDNDDIYKPDNCRWITLSEQQFNKGLREDLVYTPDGISIKQYCKLAGLAYTKENRAMLRENFKICPEFFQTF